MRECIEEGILQAYVDDELSPETAEKVASHISACATCADLASTAADESMLFANAFAAEMAQEVPTVSLRERLDAAIAELNRPAAIFDEKSDSRLSGWLASFAGLFKVSPQRALGFASLLAVVAFAAIFAVIKWNRADTGKPNAVVASVDKIKPEVINSIPSPTPAETPNTNPNPAPNKEGNDAPGNKPRTPKKQPNPILVPAPDELPKGELAIAKPLPGEQNYLKAIDSLTVEIEASDATAMKPSLRAEYERNLAIVDQAIDSTRRVARRNPNNADASEFLYSSYQSKLDLLSAVAAQVRPTVATR
jgi:hypothetical protein